MANARMYDSETARFIQEDTYRGNPNDPLSLNLYTYCENNPLIYNDPTGHWPEFVNKAVKTVKQAVKNAWNWLTNKPGNPVPDVKESKNSNGDSSNGQSKNNNNNNNNNNKNNTTSKQKNTANSQNSTQKQGPDPLTSWKVRADIESSVAYKIVNNPVAGLFAGISDVAKGTNISKALDIYSGANFFTKALLSKDNKKDRETHLKNTLCVFNAVQTKNGIDTSREKIDYSGFDFNQIDDFNNSKLIASIFPDKKAYVDYIWENIVRNRNVVEMTKGLNSSDWAENILKDYDKGKHNLTYDKLTKEQIHNLSGYSMKDYDSKMFNEFNKYYLDLAESGLDIVTIF